MTDIWWWWQFLELTITYMFKLYLENMTHLLMKSLNLKIKGEWCLCQTRQRCFVTWEMLLQCLDDSMVCTDQQSISSRTMTTRAGKARHINPLNAELNPTCHLLALLGAHHILHVSRIRVKEHPHVTPQKKGSQISRRLIPRKSLSWCQSEEDFDQMTVLGEPFYMNVYFQNFLFINYT